MRIVAGKLRGRTLKELKGLDIRPTSERVREAIFSSLSSRLNFDRISVLDLFAGSGALGLEALSRGASNCVFVEKQKPVADVLNQNLKALGLSAHGVVVNKKTEDFLKSNHASFDLILADPPYREVNEVDFLNLLLDSGVFANNSYFIFEDALITGLESYDRFEIVYRKKYGDSVVSMFKYRG